MNIEVACVKGPDGIKGRNRLCERPRKVKNKLFKKPESGVASKDKACAIERTVFVGKLPGELRHSFSPVFTGFMLGVLFFPECGDDMFLRNVGLSAIYTALQSRRQGFVPVRGMTIKFANSPPCACRGSSGQKPQYGLMTMAYQVYYSKVRLDSRHNNVVILVDVCCLGQQDGFNPRK
jgi:hypothetical protein